MGSTSTNENELSTSQLSSVKNDHTDSQVYVITPNQIAKLGLSTQIQSIIATQVSTKPVPSEKEESSDDVDEQILNKTSSRSHSGSVPMRNATSSNEEDSVTVNAVNASLQNKMKSKLYHLLNMNPNCNEPFVLNSQEAQHTFRRINTIENNDNNLMTKLKYTMLKKKQHLPMNVASQIRSPHSKSTEKRNIRGPDVKPVSTHIDLTMPESVDPGHCTATEEYDSFVEHRIQHHQPIQRTTTSAEAIKLCSPKLEIVSNEVVNFSPMEIQNILKHNVPSVKDTAQQIVSFNENILKHDVQHTYQIMKDSAPQSTSNTTINKTAYLENSVSSLDTSSTKVEKHFKKKLYETFHVADITSVEKRFHDKYDQIINLDNTTEDYKGSGSETKSDTKNIKTVTQSQSQIVRLKRKDKTTFLPPINTFVLSETKKKIDIHVLNTESTTPDTLTDTELIELQSLKQERAAVENNQESDINLHVDIEKLEQSKGIPDAPHLIERQSVNINKKQITDKHDSHGLNINNELDINFEELPESTETVQAEISINNNNTGLLENIETKSANFQEVQLQESPEQSGLVDKISVDLDICHKKLNLVASKLLQQNVEIATADTSNFKEEKPKETITRAASLKNPVKTDIADNIQLVSPIKNIICHIKNKIDSSIAKDSDCQEKNNKSSQNTLAARIVKVHYRKKKDVPIPEVIDCPKEVKKSNKPQQKLFNKVTTDPHTNKNKKSYEVLPVAKDLKFDTENFKISLKTYGRRNNSSSAADTKPTTIDKSSIQSSETRVVIADVSETAVKQAQQGSVITKRTKAKTLVTQKSTKDGNLYVQSKTSGRKRKYVDYSVLSGNVKHYNDSSEEESDKLSREESDKFDDADCNKSLDQDTGGSAESDGTKLVDPSKQETETSEKRKSGRPKRVGTRNSKIDSKTECESAEKEQTESSNISELIYSPSKANTEKHSTADSLVTLEPEVLRRGRSKLLIEVRESQTKKRMNFETLSTDRTFLSVSMDNSEIQSKSLEKKRRGRPRKILVEVGESKSHTNGSPPALSTTLGKRGRGRPRKVAVTIVKESIDDKHKSLQRANSEKNQPNNSKDTSSRSVGKKRRGRSKKLSVESNVQSEDDKDDDGSLLEKSMDWSDSLDKEPRVVEQVTISESTEVTDSDLNNASSRKYSTDPLEIESNKFDIADKKAELEVDLCDTSIKVDLVDKSNTKKQSRGQKTVVTEEADRSEEVDKKLQNVCKELMNDSVAERVSKPVNRKRGRKPKTGNANATLCTVEKKKVLIVEHTGAPEQKKKGLKRKAIALETYNSEGSDTVTCAVCNTILAETQWINHKETKHNNLAWKVNDVPLDLTNEGLVTMILSDLCRNKKALHCESCGCLLETVPNYLKHKKKCPQSPETISGLEAMNKKTSMSNVLDTLFSNISGPTSKGVSHSNLASPAESGTATQEDEADVGADGNPVEEILPPLGMNDVRCAICKDVMPKGQWPSHKQKKHNNLAWRVDDVPLVNPS